MKEVIRIAKGFEEWYTQKHPNFWNFLHDGDYVQVDEWAPDGAFIHTLDGSVGGFVPSEYIERTEAQK